MSTIVIGNFDGVHRGHQAVLAQAKAHGGDCTVLTFDPHPTVVLGRTPPPRLVTSERRAELLVRHGADDVVIEPFTKELAGTSPEDFVKNLLVGRLGAKAVVVGENFRFGKGRAGDLALLRSLGAEHGFTTLAADVAHDERGPFSSTRARDAIAGGDLEEASRVLSRPHSLSGVVFTGDQRGRTLGFPTANIEAEEMLPPYGVYAVLVDEVIGKQVARALGPGVMNVGVRPTVDGTALRVEVHLFDFSRDLYGVRLRAHVIGRIRPEMRFGSLDALKDQIAKDAAHARVMTKGALPLSSGAYG